MKMHVLVLHRIWLQFSQTQVAQSPRSIHFLFVNGATHLCLKIQSKIALHQYLKLIPSSLAIIWPQLPRFLYAFLKDLTIYKIESSKVCEGKKVTSKGANPAFRKELNLRR